jgi:hypothetical protein
MKTRFTRIKKTQSGRLSRPSYLCGSGFICGCFLFFLTGAGAGLNQLSDDALRIELANDGLDALLQRAYVVDHIPASDRGPEQAVVALRELSDPTLSAQDRSERLQQVVDGIDTALPRINDAHVLLRAAATLVREAVEKDVNVLEYFGEDGADTTKARLQPIATTAVALYDRAVTLLDAQQTALQDKITQPGDPIAARWQAVNQEFQTAAYTRWMLAYSLALSMDRADQKRAAVCEEAIDKLGQWDTPDSGVQPIVRLQIGKLHMLIGDKLDLQRAKAVLATIIETINITPKPDSFTMFNARYFVAVCDCLRQDAAQAERDAQSADDYRRQALASVVGDEYAMDMLHYRIALLRQDNAGAVKILEDLSERAPGLRAVIAGQLLDKLPPHPDPTRLSPLMLSAVIERAWTQVRQASPDPQTLQEGLAAANQYLALADKADPRTSGDGTIDASKVRGVILKSLGRRLEAAQAFLDHAQRYMHQPDAQAAEALNEAVAQIGLLYQGQNDNAADEPHQGDITALEDRLLPLAVNSFQRYDLAYSYARRLQRSGHPAQAAQAFDLVPANDPNSFNALFFKMVALDQCLDARDLENAVSVSQLPAVLRDLQSLADRVIRTTSPRNQSMKERAILLAADVAARRAHDPHRTLALLANFENGVRGLPDAQSLIGEAFNLRVAAHMEAGETAAATDALVKYLNTVGGNEGLQTVYNLLTQLNHELDRAQTAGEGSRVKELADDRAALTPFLVRWAQSNPNPDISKFTYRYRVFDAATQKQAAELETEAGSRAVKLKAALAAYEELQTPDNVKLYQASLPPDAGDDVRDYPDPAVILGIADTAFALGDWKQAHDSIGQLLADSKLGDGTIVVKNADGQSQTTDNEQFWQAEYEFIDATLQMARDPDSGVKSATAKIILNRLQTLWQDRIGGDQWHRKFAELDRIVNAQ